MAGREFILQGITPRTHGDAFDELFDVKDVERVLLSVAFVNEGGVEQVREKLTKHKSSVTFYAGIRNDITSIQGLDMLRSCVKFLYTVDTGSVNLVFHPKIYAVKGSSCARVLIGSANMTLGGLFNNIEAGVLLSLDRSIDEDQVFLAEIEGLFDGLPKDYPDHIVRVASSSQLRTMLLEGRIADENARRPSVKAAGASPGAAGLTRMRLKTIPRRRPTRKLPARAVPLNPLSAVLTNPLGIQDRAFEQCWRSTPLAERDLNVPRGPSTNKTGSINLDRGQFEEGIDWRSYFREVIFDHLSWGPSRRKTVEQANAKFSLVVTGVYLGEYDLVIAHSTSKTSAAYRQKNAMTRLRWGAVREKIARRDLIGRILTLSRDIADPDRFLIEID